MSTRLSAMLLAVAVLATPAGANPLPEAWFFTHVQSGTTLIGTCEEVTQYSSATGVLTFDLYLWPSYDFYQYEEIGVGEIRAVFEWPTYWEFVEASLPAGAEGEITSLADNRRAIDVTWPLCPTQPREQPLFHFARFRLDVTAQGQCRAGANLIGGDPFAWGLCYPELAPFARGADGVPAVAGSPCSDCPLPCNAYEDRMSYTPESLELEVETGRSVTGELTAVLPTSGHTDPVYDATEPYLTVAATPLDPGDDLLVVTADAAGLAPGEYLGHVRAVSPGCTWCCPVSLTVLPATEVRPTTWGRIKTAYDE